MAATPADAAAVPVTQVWRTALVAVSLATLGSGLGAQRRELAFGLKGGRHVVRVHPYGSPGHAFPIWAPADSGQGPLLMYVGDAHPALDTVLAGYLASHGFVVAVLQGRGSVDVAEALRTAARLPFVDSTRVAIARWGGGPRATAILDFDASDSVPRTLAIQALADSGLRPFLRVTLPRSSARPGAEAARRYRLLCAVTHTILNAMLRAHPTLTELALRLKAAGLETEINQAP